MGQFDEKREANETRPFFKFVRHYMNMVLVIYTFIRASRDGLWQLHLSSLDELCKYFFAHDKQKYARLVPLYLAEMTALEVTDPDIYKTFLDGNFTVTRTSYLFVMSGWIMRSST